jgi:hypothetical protein
LSIREFNNNNSLYEEVDGIEYMNVLWVFGLFECRTEMLTFKQVCHSTMQSFPKLLKGIVMEKERGKDCKGCK